MTASGPGDAPTLRPGDAPTLRPDTLPGGGPPLIPVAPPEQKLGVYRLVRLIGRGGMGVVWEAVDERLGRRVAVKVLLSTYAGDGEAVARFRREALAAARLRHPRIVPVHDVGEDAGRLFLVMDLVEGATLADALRDELPSHRAVATALEQVARAVHYAHGEGIIHRDLKPANILLDRSRAGDALRRGTETRRSSHTRRLASAMRRLSGPATSSDDIGLPLVSDFGLAREEGAAALSQDGRAIGTPQYMPPEQAEGRGAAIGPPSDVYALGAILYEALAGRPPFVGERVAQILRAVIADDPVPPSQIAAGVPRDLQIICLKCLEKRPERRYPTAEALADDLHAWLEGEPIAARPPSRIERFARRVRRNPSAWLIGTAATLVIALGAAWSVWSLDERRREAERAAAQAETALHRYETEARARQQAEAENAALSAGRAREWVLVFSDDFSQPGVEERWDFRAEKGGGFAVEDGALVAHGEQAFAALIRGAWDGDLRLEFTCRMESDFLNDISCLLAAPMPPEGVVPWDGYHFKYGGFGNTRTVLTREAQAAQTRGESPLVRGRSYHAVAERIGDRLSYRIDGHEVLSWRDDRPLHGGGRITCGLFSWGTRLRWDDVKLWRLAEPRVADLVELARRSAERDRLDTAHDLFLEALVSERAPERQAAARRGLAEVEQRRALRTTAPRLEAELQRRWPEAKARLGEHGLVVRLAGSSADALAALQGLAVAELDLSDSGITDLRPLAGLPLRRLVLDGNPIADLAPIAGLGLEHLGLARTAVTDLAPLRGMPLARLDIGDTTVADLAPLAGGRLEHLRASRTAIRDLTPLRGMPMRQLEAEGTAIADLAPLSGAPLWVLDVSGTRVADLAPLRGANLLTLRLNGCPVRDLTPLAGMPLAHLTLSATRVEDLTPLRGMPLENLAIEDTPVADIAPLTGINLRGLQMHGARVRSLGPILAQPPHILTYDNAELPDAELAMAIAAWSTRYPRQADEARAVLAARHRDGATLRALARPFRGRRYLVVLGTFTAAEARALASAVGARLAVVDDVEVSAHLRSLTTASAPRWVGAERRDGVARWHDGRPVAWPVAPGPDGALFATPLGGPLASDLADRPGTRPAVLEWDDG